MRPLNVGDEQTLRALKFFRIHALGTNMTLLWIFVAAVS